MTRKTLIAALLAACCSSCIKDELPVAPVERGTVTKGQASIGVDYSGQVWYDLGTNTAVSSNSKMDWDLAFECGADGWRIRLNSARSMRAVVLDDTALAAPLDTTGFAALWSIDAPSGAADSTAIGDRSADRRVIAIDMGYAVNGLPMGLRQLRVLSIDGAGYTVELADATGGGVVQRSIARDPGRDYAHFSMLNDQVVAIAPPTGGYDLVFTQFTTRFSDPPMTYLVTGAVLGFSGARVAALQGAFADVTLDDTLQHPFSAAEDAIGYGWKEYDFDAGVYTVDPERIHIVHDATGNFFKLHFIDFYNDLGERGCPTFEFVQL